MNAGLSNLVQPITLQKGGCYLWMERDTAGEAALALLGGSARPDVSLVQFVEYDICPAFVIIINEQGKRRRCLRQELFVYERGSVPVASKR